MVWVYLIVAGLLEVVWASFMKECAGFTKLVPSVITIVAMIFSFFLLALAMKQMPLGQAYTIWTGIGAVGSVIAGLIFFGDTITLTSAICVVLIIAGVVGLGLLGGGH